MTGDPTSKIVIGAAALGQTYGLDGRMGAAGDELGALLAAASEAGVRAVDTAPAYGDSERVLGKSLPADMAAWTKTVAEDEDIVAGVRESLRVLGRERLELVQWHNWSAATGEDRRFLGPWEELRGSAAVVELGATTYGAADALAAVRSGRFSLVQVEWNVLDQGVVQAIAAEARERGVRIAVRSVLLQGLLAGLELPEWLAPLGGPLGRARELARAQDVSLYHLALRAAIDHPDIDHVLVGIRNRSDLDGLLEVARGQGLDGAARESVADLNCSGESALDPRTWATRRATI